MNAFGCTVPNPILTRELKSVGNFLFLSPAIPAFKKIEPVMMVARDLLVSASNQ